MTALPDWMIPPRDEGWFADDLDHLPEAPRHTELIDGALVFMMSPQRRWHARVVRRLVVALEDQAPEGVTADQEMTIRLDKRNRPEPDVVVSSGPADNDETWIDPAVVLLAVEVVSPESGYRDKTVKMRKYAEAGIANYWLVEDEDGQAVVHVYELDVPTKTYVPVAIARDVLELSVPFPIAINLAALVAVKNPS
ncbi:Uma2 family endonuclease [Kibdelosporangium lantanae]|uniref:Uma2 family endonuclease n=1 Tax=Kibdelosporangium lantanae TaxID=1497396 RepID=A0ABW3M4S0_9PSEU